MRTIRVASISFLLLFGSLFADQATWIGRPHAWNEEIGAGYASQPHWRLWLEHATHPFAVASCWGTSLGSPSISPAPPTYCGNDPNPPNGADPGDCSATPGGINLSSATSYRMTADRTANGGDGNVCFNLGNGTKVDLNGHTINGRINLGFTSTNGVTITNGIISCTAGVGGTACVELEGAGTISTGLYVQYVNCTVNGANDNARCLNTDFAPTAVTTTDNFSIHYLFNTVTASANGVSREYAMNVQGQRNNTDCEWNVWFLPATSFGAQGCSSQSAPSKIWINNNWGVSATNSSGQDPRGAIIDNTGQSMESSCSGIDRQIRYNTIYARNGRAVRIRSVNCVAIQYNTIFDAATVDVGAIHVGDDNKPTFNPYTYCEISNNTFSNVQAAVIALIGVRSASGCVSHDNNISSFAGTPVFGNVTNLSAMGNPTGTVNTNGTTTVTWVSGGTLFAPTSLWGGLTITIAGVPYTIVSVAGIQNTLVTTVAVPTATGAAFSVNTGPLTSSISFTRDPVMANPNITVTGVDANDPAASTVCNSGVASQGVFATVTNLSNSACPIVSSLQGGATLQSGAQVR